MESMGIFKSYLRRLLQDLKDLRRALEAEDYERAKEITRTLEEDTQKGIEDN